MNCSKYKELMIHILPNFGMSYKLIVEAWARGCDYDSYSLWCKNQNITSLEQKLFDVYYEALADEYIFETGGL